MGLKTPRRLRLGGDRRFKDAAWQENAVFTTGVLSSDGALDACRRHPLMGLMRSQAENRFLHTPVY